ncbi:VanZ family protein [Bergeyella sp. RCAD1439]|uniref:VanZ family protein n=1 Tax=Bergeyella anatis TaxID=3113737 RepID=UPI002E18B2CB|nr:VanZ family protein [Bergeyella sp. RCAD1439]
MNYLCLEMWKRLYRIAIIPYTILLLYLMLLGVGRAPMDHYVVRLVLVGSTLEFVRQNILWGRWWNLVVNILGNVFLFVPFGFLGWMNERYKDLGTLLRLFWSALLLVEAAQYFSRMGVFDVDDFLLNTLGVWLGYVLRGKIDALRCFGRAPFEK